jgi:hypothetical protein
LFLGLAAHTTGLPNASNQRFTATDGSRQHIPQGSFLPRYFFSFINIMPTESNR